MGRRVVDPARLDQAEAAASSIDEMVARRSAGKRAKSVPRAEIEREIADVDRRVDADDWATLRPGQLVAVYAWCHKRAYGVLPEELIGLKWAYARRLAGLLVKRQFGDDVEAALEFMRWVWGRESARVERCKKNGRQVRRISYYDQFTTGWLLTDYRVDRSVHAGKGP